MGELQKRGEKWLEVRKEMPNYSKNVETLWHGWFKVVVEEMRQEFPKSDKFDIMKSKLVAKECKKCIKEYTAFFEKWLK